MTDSTPHPSVSVWRSAFGNACPRCGQGRIFQQGFRVAPHCESCGLPLHLHDIGDAPAVILSFVLGFTLVPAFLFLGLAYDWGLPLTLLLMAMVTTAAILGLMRPIKAFTLAMQYAYRRVDYEDPETGRKTRS